MPRWIRAWLPCLALLVAASAGAVESESDWEPRDEFRRDGYVYRMFSRDEGDGLVRYQIRGSVEAPPRALFDAVRVVMGDPSLAPDGQTRTVLAQDDTGGFVIHTYIDLPMMFSDRDIITQGVGSIAGDGSAHRIDWRAIDHEAMPRREGVIRIERSDGFWLFEPEGDAGSSAVYETFVDLGGSLPAWLISGMMSGMVAEVFDDVADVALGR